MNSALSALLGLTISIILIIRKVSPVYSLLAGAVIGGLASGWGLQATVSEMIGGVKDITPAIVRIIAAGVLTGALVVTGAAERISQTIVEKLGRRQTMLALALSAMILTAIGVFIDVAVITVAPIALTVGGRMGLSRGRVLLAMIGGGKCGNIISPNPNTIISAENFGSDLQSVMGAGLIPALIGLVIVVYVIIPLIPERECLTPDHAGETGKDSLPSLAASIAGPLVTVMLLALRPIAGITVDPLIALPVGGLAGILATSSVRRTYECLSYGLAKMSGIAVLLVGTGTIAGIIKASAIKDVLVSLLSGWDAGAMVMAPLSGTLMCAASASTTAGATIASASFAETILAAGISAVWAAEMTNAGATVLDHLPHGSFFHATGGAAGMDVKERLRLIPYETMVGLTLTILSIGCYWIIGA